MLLVAVDTTVLERPPLSLSESALCQAAGRGKCLGALRETALSGASAEVRVEVTTGLLCGAPAGTSLWEVRVETKIFS